MTPPTSPLRLLPVVLSFAIGFGLAWVIRDPGSGAMPAVAAAAHPAGTPGFGDAWNAPAPAPPAPPAASAQALAADAGVDALWTLALQPGERGEAAFQAEDRLRKLAQGDPAARRKLIGFYDTAPTSQARELLKTILATVQAPDVVFFANRLANSSNAAERGYGFDLLRSVAPNAPETRSLARQVLATEQAPAALLGALSTLQAGAADPDEAAQVVAQLASLSQHADPAVRSRSLQQLGQWDKAGDSSARLAGALGDSAAQVRQAAIFAIAQSGTRAPQVKESLLALAANGQESREVRASALQVLERFPLSKEDYASFVHLRGQLQGSPGER